MEKASTSKVAPYIDDVPYSSEKNSKYVEEEEEEEECCRRERFSFKKLWKFTGPGFLMSIAYLDPGNIESDLQSGAAAQYKLIWVLLAAHILGLLMQRLSARIGVVTGQDMAQVSHSYYSRPARFFLWIMVEIAIIASDMQEVIGTAISIYLLSNRIIPLWGGVLITIIDTFSFLLLERYSVRYFEAFFCLLISCMAAAFGFEFIKTKPDGGALMKGMVLPWCDNCDQSQFLQAVSIIGAVVMPHNFYLHSALVKSRDINRSKKREVSEANFYYLIESAIALFCSFIINVLVMAVFAKGLYGKTNMEVRDMCVDAKNNLPDFYRTVYNNNTDDAESDIYHAGIYLGCSFGAGALYVWAVGILAAGQSSTMTGTYAGQFAMEGFIQLRMPKWKRLLITRSLAIMPTLAVAIFSGGVTHISGMNDFLNCVQMLQLPFAFIPVLTFVADKRLMGDFACSLGQKVFAFTASILILGINIFFLYQWCLDEIGFTWVSTPIIIIVALVYLVFTVYLGYYCLVAIGVTKHVDNKMFPAPDYSRFDSPWEKLPEIDCCA